VHPVLAALMSSNTDGENSGEIKEISRSRAVAHGDGAEHEGAVGCEGGA